MSEEAIEIRTADGTVDGFLYRPDSGAGPGLLHLTDIGGIRPAHREMAKRQAQLGYTVLLPNVFYRVARPPLFDFTPNFADERTRKRFAELAGAVTPEGIERDAPAYLDFLAAHSGSAGARPAAVVGYCFTGGVALRMAAACPERIALAASFHGGGLYNDAPTSPHRVLPRVRARLYFGHAENDGSMPQEAIDKLNQALAAWGGKYESEVYAGARHGWTVPGGPAYNESQAERAFDKLATLLRETLE